jgi:hypothetical protein
MKHYCGVVKESDVSVVEKDGVYYIQVSGMQGTVEPPLKDMVYVALTFVSAQETLDWLANEGARIPREILAH